MNIRKLALVTLVGGAACGNAMALITPSTVGPTTTYFENFEGSTSFSAGRVNAGSDDYMWLSALAPTSSFTFTSLLNIASLTLDFYFSVPGNNNAQFSLLGPAGDEIPLSSLGDTPGNALQFLGNNPGASTGGFNNFDSFRSTTVTDLAAGTYTLTFSTLGGALNSLKVDDVNIAVTAVPEPETYALMLGGLGLVGWIARRRRPSRDLT